MSLILTHTVFILTLFPFPFYFPKRNSCHVGFSQEKNEKSWCKISVMWIDTSWDNYILPVQSFNDSLIWGRGLLLFKNLSNRTLYSYVFSVFHLLRKKKTQLQLVKTTTKKELSKAFFFSLPSISKFI